MVGARDRVISRRRRGQPQVHRSGVCRDFLGARGNARMVVARFPDGVAVRSSRCNRRSHWRGGSGYVPYAHNLFEHGDPFYPVTPKHGFLSTTKQVPANLLHADRVTRFVVSNFARSEPVRPPQSTRTKFPLSIGSEERRGLYGADLESGGFGPLYGALLLLAGVGGLALCIRRSTRPTGGIVLITAGCIWRRCSCTKKPGGPATSRKRGWLPMLVAIPSLSRGTSVVPVVARRRPRRASPS